LAKEAAQRSAELRDAWFRKLADWNADQVIFLDESGVNARSGDRTHGWSPKGQIIPKKIAFKRHGNFSVLPAMSVNGYLACCVYEGAVNADTYIASSNRTRILRCRIKTLFEDNICVH
jgi:hypothetical protein